MDTFKKICCIMAFCLGCFSGISQNDKLVMSSKGSFDKKELRDILDFQGMDYYKVSISGEQLKNKNYYIVSKEFWKGKIKKTDTIFDSRQHEVFRIGKDTLAFRIMSGKTSEKNLRVQFFFERFGINRNFKCTKSDAYSLRDSGTLSKINFGKPFYAFACILPTEHKDGSKSWCEVDADADMENWGKNLGIEHYLLFEMKFY
ncbi:hypothetical protein [Flavobacterium silvaticum]|uniref:Uncharacterized protein n=1 Tax=Flavobacterium silvaticum TaxID=1852020 RepID=A0A972FPM3_9FLAO|nr:hypothetical protein [Flavobacterium silvaticum]NMH27094.1 hypothetical protein [Flavobacterium silvaticum]